MYYLYGAPHSAYTGKARSYMIKQGIAFEERAFGHDRFMKDIIGTIQRFFIPVLETPDGTFIQDTSDILDYFLNSGQEVMPARPTGAVARAITHLFELFGGEGMLRPGMYYRWFFDDANMAFIEDQFGLFAAPTVPTGPRLEETRRQTGAMRKAADHLGVNDETGPAIEESYLAFLEALDAHFLSHPYIVGHAPTLGDYALQIMFFAHLSRDPYPAAIMKDRAQAVFRFTERMNLPGINTPEYVDFPQTHFADDAIPETLKTLMRLVAQDYLPEVAASIAAHNEWLATNDVQEGDKSKRAIGRIMLNLRGTEVTCGARTYPLYVQQRLQDFVDSLGEAAKAPVLALFEETGCLPFIDLRADRRVERVNNHEVWGALRS